MAQQKIEGLQRVVDETTCIMDDNVKKTMARGEHLDNLEERAEHLNRSAKDFEMAADKVRKKYWLENNKWLAIGIGVGVGAVMIIILAVVLSLKPWK